MSNVDQIRNDVLLFSNPTWNSDVSVPTTTVRNVSALTPDLAYSETIEKNITTISSKYAETENGIIQGFLYVPALQSTDYCYEWALENIPANVTHRTDLPPTDLRRIALAPWVDIECTQDYLSAARNEGIRALIFYRPGGGTNSKPRSGNDIIWALNDSFLWKEQNHFPVYAIPSLVGESLVDHLADYNGKVSQVPNGNNITERYQPNDGDYIRIWTQITVSSKSELPQVWVFALIILGIIAGVILLTSFTMHAVHYRRRRILRRRVVSGKVDLEALGIKKIPVPRWAVRDGNLWPIFTYSGHDDPDITQPPSSPLSSTFSIRTGLGREAQRALYPIDHQPRCELCTRHYVKLSTLIKEAPCRHIFHPGCIDDYTARSSLCPLCKTCLLPKGWSPRITNAMVRKERNIRKFRQVVYSDEESGRRSSPVSSRVQRLFSPAPSTISSNGEHTPAMAQARGRDMTGHRQVLRNSQTRQMWSRASRRTPPLNHLPTVSEAEGNFPPLPDSPAASQHPTPQTPDALTSPTSRPPSQPSPLPFPPQPAHIRNSTSEEAVVAPNNVAVEPLPEHHAADLEHVRPSPSSSTRRRRMMDFLGPDIDDESPQRLVTRAFRKVFPGL